MSDEEKQISFLNRYFVFRKTREVSSASMRRLQSILAREDLGEKGDDESEDSGIDEMESELRFSLKKGRKMGDVKMENKKDTEARYRDWETDRKSVV